MLSTVLKSYLAGPWKISAIGTTQQVLSRGDWCLLISDSKKSAEERISVSSAYLLLLWEVLRRAFSCSPNLTDAENRVRKRFMDTDAVLKRLRFTDSGTFLNGTSEPNVIEILEAEHDNTTPAVSTLAESDGRAIDNDELFKDVLGAENSSCVGEVLEDPTCETLDDSEVIATKIAAAEFTALVDHIDSIPSALGWDGLVEMDLFDDGVMVNPLKEDFALMEEKLDRERSIELHALGSIPRTEADADDSNGADLPSVRLPGLRRLQISPAQLAGTVELSSLIVVRGLDEDDVDVLYPQIRLSYV